MSYLGDFATNNTIYDKFVTTDSNGAATNPSSALEASDIEVYKNGVTTNRATNSGFTVTSSFNSVVGLHHYSIDLSDDSDAGFYATNSEYQVVFNPDETIDGQDVVAVLSEFSIENRPVQGLSSTAKDNIASNNLDAAGADGFTLRELARGVAAILMGEVSGGPDSPDFMQIGTSSGTNRVLSESDTDGNRTSVTLNLS